MAVIRVRPAEPADALRIAEVHVRSWQSGYAGILDDAFLADLDIAPRHDRWRRRLAEPGASSTWVVELDGELVGFAGLGPSRDADLDGQVWRELMTCYLLPSAWGSGAAGVLVGRAVPEDENHFLWVLSDNHRAQAFYRKHGFAADGAVRPIELGGREVPELRMRRPAN